MPCSFLDFRTSKHPSFEGSSRARDIDTIIIIIYYTRFVNRFLKISFDFFEISFFFQDMQNQKTMLQQKSCIFLQKICFYSSPLKGLTN